MESSVERWTPWKPWRRSSKPRRPTRSAKRKGADRRSQEKMKAKIEKIAAHKCNARAPSVSPGHGSGF